jgi:hypothetical protein
MVDVPRNSGSMFWLVLVTNFVYNFVGVLYKSYTTNHKKTSPVMTNPTGGEVTT